MNIILNGETYSIEAECTAEKLIARLGLHESKFAVEINGEILTRSAYARHGVQAGDRIEIIHAVGGG